MAKLKRVAAMVRAELLEWLDQEAEAEARTRSQMAAILIEEALLERHHEEQQARREG